MLQTYFLSIFNLVINIETIDLASKMCRYTHKSYTCGHADPRKFQRCALALDTGRECFDDNDRPLGRDRVIPQPTFCSDCDELPNVQGQQEQPQQQVDEGYCDRPRSAYPASHVSAASEVTAAPQYQGQSHLHNTWPGQSAAHLSHAERIVKEQMEQNIGNSGNLVSEETFGQRQARRWSELEDAQRRLEEALQWERDRSFPRLVAQSEADLAWHNEQAIQRAIQLSLHDARMNEKSLDEYFHELKIAEEVSAREADTDDEALHQARLASMNEFADSIYQREPENADLNNGSNAISRIVRIGYRGCEHVVEYVREAEYPGQPLPKTERRDGMCDHCQVQNTSSIEDDKEEAEANAIEEASYDGQEVTEQLSDKYDQRSGCSSPEPNLEAREQSQSAGTAARDHWRNHSFQQPARADAPPSRSEALPEQEHARVPVAPSQATQPAPGMPSMVLPEFAHLDPMATPHLASPTRSRRSTRNKATASGASSHAKEEENWTLPPLRSPSPVATIRTAESNRQAEEGERERLFAQRLQQLGSQVPSTSGSQSEALTSPTPSITTGGRQRRQRRIVVPASLLRDAQEHARTASSATSVTPSTTPSTVRHVGPEGERNDRQTSELQKSG